MRVGLSTSLKAFTAFLMLGGAFDIYAQDTAVANLAKQELEIAKQQELLSKQRDLLPPSQKRNYENVLQELASRIENSDTRKKVLDDVSTSFKKPGVSTVVDDGLPDSSFDEEEEPAEPSESVSGWMSQVSVNDVYGNSSYSPPFSSPPPKQTISVRPSSGWSSSPSQSFSGRGQEGDLSPYQDSYGDGGNSGWSSSLPSDPRKMQASSGWGSPPRPNDSFSQSMPSRGQSSYVDSGGLGGNSGWPSSLPSRGEGVIQSQYQGPPQDPYGSSGLGGQGMSADASFGDMSQYSSVPDSSSYGQDISSDPMVQWANERPVNDIYGADASLGPSYDSSVYGASGGMSPDQGYGGQDVVPYDSSADIQQQYSSDDMSQAPYDPGVLTDAPIGGDFSSAAQEYGAQQQQVIPKPASYQEPSQIPYQAPLQQVMTSPALTAPVQSAPLVMGASNQFTKMVSDPSNAAGNVQVALRDNNPATHLAFAQSFVDKNYAATTKVPLEKSRITLVGDGKFLYAKVGVAQTKLNITPEGMQMLRATMDYPAEYNRIQTVKTIINAGIFPPS